MNVGTALGLCFSLAGSFGIESYSMTCPLTVYVSGDFSSSFGGLGHAFVSIKNNSMISVSAGYMSLPPLGQATLGTWGNMDDHLGVWNTVSCDALDPGLINTPSNLYSSVISKSYYVTNATIPNNSNVGYYANTYFVPYYGSGPSNIVEVTEA